MTEMEKLKKQLGEQYRFGMIMSLSDVKIILENNNNKFYSDMVVFSLLVGCVGIEATIMDRCLRPKKPNQTSEKLLLFYNPDSIVTDLFIRYDVIIKAKQADGQWCSYEPLETEVNLDVKDMEQEMFRILYYFAQDQGLSFTEYNDSENPRREYD